MDSQKFGEDEIKLIEIFNVLWKRKIFIASSTMALIVLSSILVFILTPVYEITAILEPGLDLNYSKPEGKTTIVSPDSVRETIIGGAYNETIRKKLNILAKDYPKIKASVPKNTPLVYINIESSKPERDLAVLKELVKLVASSLDERVELQRGRLKNQISLTEIENRALLDKIDLIKGQIAEIKEKIKDLYRERQKAMSSKPSDAMSVLLYSNEIQNQQIYLNTLEEKYKDLQEKGMGADIRINNLRLSLEKSVGVHINKAPIVSEVPIKPKKLLIISLAAILGLIGSMILAFLLGYVDRENQSEKI